ncbi:hypothetical protein HEP84_55020 [Streptomyces sp. RLB1-33]|nr:hypothetical protein [Streptomyces sp. RLB1-33]
MTNHASEEKGSQSVQGGALLQQTEALFVPGEDVEVGAAWRVCGVLGEPAADLHAVPSQNADPVSGEHGAVDGRDLLVETVGK